MFQILAPEGSDELHPSPQEQRLECDSQEPFFSLIYARSTADGASLHRQDWTKHASIFEDRWCLHHDFGWIKFLLDIIACHGLSILHDANNDKRCAG